MHDNKDPYQRKKQRNAKMQDLPTPSHSFRSDNNDLGGKLQHIIDLFLNHPCHTYALIQSNRHSIQQDHSKNHYHHNLENNIWTERTPILGMTTTSWPTSAVLTTEGPLAL